MDMLILAGGFATRLRPLSEYIPKPLFPICGVPLLNYILERVEEIKPKRIIISTNKRFEYHFRYWLKTQDLLTRDKIELIVEPTTKEEEKFGAIKGLAYSVKEAWVEDDLLVLAGDNLFDFDLRKIRRFMKEKKTIVFGLYDVKDINEAKRFGVVEIDDDYKVISFQEKPDYPRSTLISTGIYGIPYDKLDLIEVYINENKHKDAIGKFFEWLVRRIEVYGYPYEGKWFDIGTIDAYIEANNYVEKIGLFRKWI